MTRRKAKLVRREGPFRWYECPFCNHQNEVGTALAWCTGCGVEWTRTDENVFFDDKKKTPNFAWGKAIQQSGGTQFGSIREVRGDKQGSDESEDESTLCDEAGDPET